MKLSFQVASGDKPQTLDVDIETFIVAGWAGRDADAIQHHIEELAAVGVPPPSAVPLYYRVSSNQLTQAERVQVIGTDSSGEVETLVFAVEGELYVSLASDHTDRKLETYSVAMSKQVCPKPVARDAWRFSEVADYWDELVIRSYIKENGATVLYQEGTLAALLPPSDLIVGYRKGGKTLSAGTAMSCGTVGAIGGIRSASSFTMELFDLRRQRTIRHSYEIESLPEVA